MTAVMLPGAPAEFDLLLRATLLIGAAWAAAAGLRRAGAPAAARHTAWLLGIAALLALPLLWWWMPALRLPMLPPEAIPAAAAPPSVVAGPAAAGSAASGLPGWRELLLAAYLLGAAALLLRLAVGRRLLARLWRDADPAGDPAWQALLSSLSREMRLTRPVELRIARGPAMPMTWGTLAPKILLPGEASAWPPERRRLVLLHELAHVARRDSLGRSLASLACALYWFHPGAWFAARRMRMEQEHAADDRVLTAGGSAQAYARSLLHIAREIGGRLEPDLAATMAGMYQLERRLISITGTARRSRPTPAFLSSSALLAALATLILATGVPVGASSTLLVPLPAEPAGSAGDRGEARAPARRERASSGQAGALDALGRTSEVAAASRPSREGRASEARSLAEGGSGALPPESEPIGPAVDGGRGGAPASARQLPDYRWELRQRDSRAQLESLTAPLEPARFASPAPLPDSRERTGRPKWAQIVPQLVRPGTSTRAPSPTSDRSLMLSLSIGVGAP